MMNGVGGSIAHWGGALRRMHPHHFAYRSHDRRALGPRRAARGHARSRTGRWATTSSSPTTTWPSASAGSPATGTPTRSCRAHTDYPMPPLRPSRKGELFREPRPASWACTRTRRRSCVNSVPYNGLPATRYHPWSAGVRLRSTTTGGTPASRRCRRRWPAATSTCARTAACCGVLTDRDGHADGVEYLDPLGEVRSPRARTVIVAGYTFENAPAADASPAGSAGSSGQLGRHFMIKLWARRLRLPARHDVQLAHRAGRADVPLDDFDAGGSTASRTASSAARRSTWRTSSCRSRSPATRCRRTCAAGGAATRSTCAAGRHRRRPHPARLAAVHRPTTSTSTRGTATAAGSACRSCASPPTCGPTSTGCRTSWRTSARDLLRQMGARPDLADGPRCAGVASSHDLGGARMGDDPRVGRRPRPAGARHARACTCSAGRSSRPAPASTRT